MRRSHAVLAVLAAGVVTVGAAAQERPDFSGVWMHSAGPAPAAAARGDRPGSVGSGWGRHFTIAQQPNRLTVERAFFTRADIQPPLRFHYALDGSESRNTVMMGRGMQEHISKATWVADTLVITTVHTLPRTTGGRALTNEVTRKLWLQPARLPAWPPLMVIETTRAGILGGPTSTTRTVYNRS